MDKSFNITLKSDNKGYFDRQCPNKECEFVFKVMIEDWKNKIIDDFVYCPRCGYKDTSDRWYTHEQVREINKIAQQYAKQYISNILDQTFGKIVNNTKNVTITYKKSPISYIENKPIEQRPEWSLEIICEKCNTRYSVIGSAFFCPLCGHNSIEYMLTDALNLIERKLNSIDELKKLYSNLYGVEISESMIQKLIESSLNELVSTFQKYMAEQYKHTSKKININANDFQILEKGSLLFKESIGYDYSQWLNDNEINYMNLQFQRRHILEHNGGIVDDRYILKSGDTNYILGQRLIIKPNEVIKLLNIIRKLCTGLHSYINKI